MGRVLFYALEEILKGSIQGIGIAFGILITGVLLVAIIDITTEDLQREINRKIRNWRRKHV